MDEQHVETSLPLLKMGYDMLLEKPFCVNKAEMKELLSVVNEHKNKVMICHVLRYSPFYLKFKEKIQSGELGDIINIQTIENVSYHHIATSFVRGKWGNSEKCHTSMLLAKCCHDMDIMMWLMSPLKPVTVSSVGARMQYRSENAPKNSGTYCLKDCPLVETCQYSAKKLYLDHLGSWEFYVWKELESVENPTMEQRIELLKHSDYGRCVYKCDNDVVDHQSVLINFSNGATGTHNMIGGAAAPLRVLKVTGTKGEIYGEFESNVIKFTKIDPNNENMYIEERLDIEDFDLDGHGGGDDNLTADFIKFVAGEKVSVSCTSIYDSVDGHNIIFLADESREANGELKFVDKQ
jgi:predicted dehydrogenase